MDVPNRARIRFEWTPRGEGYDAGDDMTAAEIEAARERVVAFCDAAARAIGALLPLERRALLEDVELALPDAVVRPKDILRALDTLLPKLDLTVDEYREALPHIPALEGASLPRAGELGADGTARAVAFTHTDIPYGAYSAPEYVYDPIRDEIVCIFNRALLLNGEPVRLSDGMNEGYADVLLRVEFTIADAS